MASIKSSIQARSSRFAPIMTALKVAPFAAWLLWGTLIALTFLAI